MLRRASRRGTLTGSRRGFAQTQRLVNLILTYRKMRWVIAAWLTLSTILNLIDRQTLSILAPFLRDKFGIPDTCSADALRLSLKYWAQRRVTGDRTVDPSSIH